MDNNSSIQELIDEMDTKQTTSFFSGDIPLEPLFNYRIQHQKFNFINENNEKKNNKFLVPIVKFFLDDNQLSSTFKDEVKNMSSLIDNFHQAGFDQDNLGIIIDNVLTVYFYFMNQSMKTFYLIDKNNIVEILSEFSNEFLYLGNEVQATVGFDESNPIFQLCSQWGISQQDIIFPFSPKKNKAITLVSDQICLMQRVQFSREWAYLGQDFQPPDDRKLSTPFVVFSKQSITKNVTTNFEKLRVNQCQALRQKDVIEELYNFNTILNSFRIIYWMFQFFIKRSKYQFFSNRIREFVKEMIDDQDTTWNHQSIMERCSFLIQAFADTQDSRFSLDFKNIGKEITDGVRIRSQYTKQLINDQQNDSQQQPSTAQTQSTNKQTSKSRNTSNQRKERSRSRSTDQIKQRIIDQLPGQKDPVVDPVIEKIKENQNIQISSDSIEVEGLNHQQQNIIPQDQQIQTQKQTQSIDKIISDNIENTLRQKNYNTESNITNNQNKIFNIVRKTPSVSFGQIEDINQEEPIEEDNHKQMDQLNQPSLAVDPDELTQITQLLASLKQDFQKEIQELKKQNDEQRKTLKDSPKNKNNKKKKQKSKSKSKSKDRKFSKKKNWNNNNRSNSKQKKFQKYYNNNQQRNQQNRSKSQQRNNNRRSSSRNRFSRQNSKSRSQSNRRSHSNNKKGFFNRNKSRSKSRQYDNSSNNQRGNSKQKRNNPRNTYRNRSKTPYVFNKFKNKQMRSSVSRKRNLSRGKNKQNKPKGNMYTRTNQCRQNHDWILCRRMHHGQKLCKYGRNCQQIKSCKFYHDNASQNIPCKYGSMCADKVCQFKHDMLNGQLYKYQVKLYNATNTMCDELKYHQLYVELMKDTALLQHVNVLSINYFPNRIDLQTESKECDQEIKNSLDFSRKNNANLFSSYKNFVLKVKSTSNVTTFTKEFDHDIKRDWKLFKTIKEEFISFDLVDQQQQNSCINQIITSEEILQIGNYPLNYGRLIQRMNIYLDEVQYTKFKSIQIGSQFMKNGRRQTIWCFGTTNASIVQYITDLESEQQMKLLQKKCKDQQSLQLEADSLDKKSFQYNLNRQQSGRLQQVLKDNLQDISIQMENHRETISMSLLRSNLLVQKSIFDDTDKRRNIIGNVINQVTEWDDNKYIELRTELYQGDLIFKDLRFLIVDDFYKQILVGQYGQDLQLIINWMARCAYTRNTLGQFIKDDQAQLKEVLPIMDEE